MDNVLLNDHLCIMLLFQYFITFMSHFQILNHNLFHISIFISSLFYTFRPTKNDNSEENEE